MTTKEKARQALVELTKQAQLREIPFDYDPAEDVMYFTLSTSGEVVTVPLAEGLYVDIDAETEQVVGIELIRSKSASTSNIQNCGKPGRRCSRQSRRSWRVFRAWRR